MTTQQKREAVVALESEAGRPPRVTGPCIRKTLLTWLAITVIGLLTGVIVISTLAIGLTVGYTLLIATEFHRQHRQHADKPDPITAAVSGALATAGRTVIYSGLTVGAALAGLLLFREPVLRSLGIGGIGATLTAVTVANTLLPALLRRSRPKNRPSETDATLAAALIIVVFIGFATGDLIIIKQLGVASPQQSSSTPQR